MNHSDRLAVDLLLQGLLIKGFSLDAVGRRRLVDVLNGQEDHLELQEVTLEGLQPRGKRCQLPATSIEKRSIIAAIPRETSDQSRHRSMANLGGRTHTRHASVMIASPPYLITGTAHALPGTGMPKVISASPVLWSAFFSVTDATISSEAGILVETEIILVNRELVATMALQDQGARTPDSCAGEPPKSPPEGP